jgi:integrase
MRHVWLLLRLVTDNPAGGLSQLYSQAKPKHEVIEPLTRKEVPTFLKVVKEHAPQHYAMFFTAIHTGVRQGELAGVQTDDIDFNGKYLVVQRSIDRVHRKVVPTKTKRIRRIDLSDELIAVLKDHIRQQKESWFKRKVPEGETPKPQPVWLFPNEGGNWPDMANIADRHFHRCMGKAGLHRRCPYDVRELAAHCRRTHRLHLRTDVTPEHSTHGGALRTPSTRCESPLDEQSFLV